MKKTLFTLLLLTTAGPAGAIDINAQTGLWRMTVETEAAGLPMQIPPITTENCVTKDDLVPQTKMPGQDCTMNKSESSGDTMRWTLQCKMQGGGDMTGKGEITYVGDSFHGTVEIAMRGPMNMTMHQKLSGKRIGDCKK